MLSAADPELAACGDEEEEAQPPGLPDSGARALLQKDWTADVAAYDKVHEQILKMADMLSDGIINQYPTKLT